MYTPTAVGQQSLSRSNSMLGKEVGSPSPSLGKNF